MNMPKSNPDVTQRVNIYKYPQEFMDSMGDITIGDLHANPIKLLHFLLKHNMICFSLNVTNPQEMYELFVQWYEYGYTILNHRLDTQVTYERNQERERIGQTSTNEETKDTEDDKLLRLTELYRQARYKTLDPNGVLAKEFGYKYWKDIIGFLTDILLELKIKNIHGVIRLLGDELGDRSTCDFFILMQYAFFKVNNINVTTLISNHGIEFLKFYYNSIEMPGTNDYANFARSGMGNPCKPSLFGLKHILEMQLISKARFQDYVENCYIPTLKVLDYNLTENGIQLFTHAPTRFDIVRVLAEKFNVVYLDETPEQLAHTIDNINNIFQEYLRDNRFNELFPEEFSDNFTRDLEPENMEHIQNNPLRYIIWNRWSATRDSNPQARPSLHPQGNYKIYYIHGHDNFYSIRPHIFNLDSQCGKGSFKNQIENGRIAVECLIYKIFNTQSLRINSTIENQVIRNTDSPRILSQSPVTTFYNQEADVSVIATDNQDEEKNDIPDVDCALSP